MRCDNPEVCVRRVIIKHLGHVEPPPGEGCAECWRRHLGWYADENLLRWGVCWGAWC